MNVLDPNKEYLRRALPGEQCQCDICMNEILDILKKYATETRTMEVVTYAN